MDARMPCVPHPLFSLQCTKARLKVTEKELKGLQWEHEVLEQRFMKVSRPWVGLQPAGRDPQPARSASCRHLLQLALEELS